jgi:lipopolysaccharide/colanic/teichoic acid biosynthesis glycosyltransferase
MKFFLLKRIFLSIPFFCIFLISLHVFLAWSNNLIADLRFLNTAFNSTLINTLAFFLSAKALKKLYKTSQKNPIFNIFSIATSFYIFCLLIVFIIRLPYSVIIILIGLPVNIILLNFWYLNYIKESKFTYCCIPFGNLNFSNNNNKYKFNILRNPVIPNYPISAIVCDFRFPELPRQWVNLLSQCAARRIPIFDLSELKENISGKVDVEHLVESCCGKIEPQQSLISIKRVFDSFLILLSLPLIIPFIIIISMLIKIDSPGTIFFVQERIGFRGKLFKLIKFRTMSSNSPTKCSLHKYRNKQKITRVGYFLRKYRFDELPQFWNVLSGEMSLIGPRPEELSLALWYEREIPFFSYRYLVRPGISGWAQVMHGHVIGIDETKDKLSYDFYYIKNFSLWLDFLIIYKTLRTILSGFGSR